MSESIYISNGKVVGDSTFYLFANDMLRKECSRICDFTDTLDKDPATKKETIAEYKCAKYRYASVSLIHNIVHHNNRCRKLHNLEYSHYLLQPFDEVFKKCAEYLALFDSASTNEKPDYSLYYGVTAFADAEIDKLKSKLPLATDWEKIELEERIDGLLFAKECLDEAWMKRKDGAK